MMTLDYTFERRLQLAEQKAEAAEQKAEHKLISQIEHHIRKGRSVDQIAEDLLESTDRIRELMARIPQANP